MPLFQKPVFGPFESEEEKAVQMGHLPAELAQRTYVDPWAEYKPQPEPEAALAFKAMLMRARIRPSRLRGHH